MCERERERLSRALAQRGHAYRKCERRGGVLRSRSDRGARLEPRCASAPPRAAPPSGVSAPGTPHCSACNARRAPVSEQAPPCAGAPPQREAGPRRTCAAPRCAPALPALPRTSTPLPWGAGPTVSSRPKTSAGTPRGETPAASAFSARSFSSSMTAPGSSAAPQRSPAATLLPPCLPVPHAAARPFLPTRAPSPRAPSAPGPPGATLLRRAHASPGWHARGAPRRSKMQHDR